MTLAAYLGGVLLLSSGLAALVWGAGAARRAHFPQLRGSTAALGHAVIALTAVLVLAEMLGTVGLLRRWPFVIGCVVVGAALRSASPRPADAPERDAGRGGDGPAWPRWLAWTTAVVVVAQWIGPTATSLRRGISDFDSLHYHLPFAARFVQEGWVTRLHFVGPDPLQAFHPANSELLDAIVMLPTHNDLLVPLVNLGWLALALTAGWAVGRSRGIAPWTLAATAVVLSSPLLAFSMPGTAGNDVVGIAMILTGVALLLDHPGSRRNGLLAGLAVGIAVGTKLTFVIPALATLLVVIAVRRTRRGPVAASWLAGVLVTGSFWYVRNLLRAGSPVPSLDLTLGPISLPSPPSPVFGSTRYSVAHYLGDREIWSDTFLPGLRYAFGPLTAAVLTVALVGSLIVLLWRHRAPAPGGRDSTRGVKSGARVRAIAAVALIGAVGYVATPFTAFGAEGNPLIEFFTINLRYATAAVTIGLVAVALWAAAWASWSRTALLVLYVGIVLANQFETGPLQTWPTVDRRDTAVALAAALVGAGAGAALRRTRGSAVAVVAIALGSVVVGWRVQQTYFDHRYETRDVGVALAEDADGVRVGVVGQLEQYPLYGADLANEVQYIGEPSPNGGYGGIADCTTFRTEVNRGRYELLVVGPLPPDGSLQFLSGPSPALAWTATDPAATEIGRDSTVAVYRLSGPMHPTSCEDP